MMEKHEIDVCWSEGDGLYPAEGPRLPGYIADGKT